MTINDVKQAIINFRATFKKIFCQFLRIIYLKESNYSSKPEFRMMNYFSHFQACRGYGYPWIYPWMDWSYPWISWISMGIVDIHRIFNNRDAVIIKLAILLNTLTSVVQWLV